MILHKKVGKKDRGGEAIKKERGAEKEKKKKKGSSGRDESKRES